MKVRFARVETDVPGIAGIVNSFEREPLEESAVRAWFEHMPPGRIALRMVAVDEDDAPIGYCVSTHETWSPDGHFYAWVGVAPSWRGRGVGQALHAELRTFLEKQGAVRVTSEVRDDDLVSRNFAAKRGFAIDRHLFASRIDMKECDETREGALLDELKTAGFGFRTVADFGDSPEARRKLYELNYETAMDIPGAGAYMFFADFEKWICEAAWYRPEGQLIAVDGETWVGLSAVQLVPETTGAYNLMTGVIKKYRGKHIAKALKVLALRYARDHGAAYMSTDNDSLNGPMLAINESLGYVPEPGKYTLVK